IISLPLLTSYFSLLSLLPSSLIFLLFFFFNDTATTEIYTLSLHDALPIYTRTAGACGPWFPWRCRQRSAGRARCLDPPRRRARRSEEHTSELQSLTNLVCRLLLEKKNKATLTLYGVRTILPSAEQTPSVSH